MTKSLQFLSDDLLAITPQPASQTLGFSYSNSKKWKYSESYGSQNQKHEDSAGQFSAQAFLCCKRALERRGARIGSNSPRRNRAQAIAATVSIRAGARRDSAFNSGVERRRCFAPDEL
jgi:hypothetical protein